MEESGTDYDSDDYRSDSTIEEVQPPRRVEPARDGTLPRPIGEPTSTRIHRRTSSNSANTATNNASTSGPSSKRQRTSTTNPSQAPPTFSTLKSIEQIDLSQDSDPDNAALSSTLAKQRSDAITSQSNSSRNAETAGKSKLNTLQCTVCLDTPTDLTATSCGHTFCYTCLMDWLVAADREAGGGGRRSNCPACRKPISRVKKGDVVPLQIKMMRRRAK